MKRPQKRFGLFLLPMEIDANLGLERKLAILKRRGFKPQVNSV